MPPQPQRQLPADAMFDLGRQVRQTQSKMPSALRATVFMILFLVSLGFGFLVGSWNGPMGFLTAMAGIVASSLVSSAIVVANQWERGIVLRLGRFIGLRGPGLFFIVPVVDRARLIDMRILTYHIRKQEVITRDNVPVTIDSVLYYRVTTPEDAVMKIQDFSFAIAQLAQSALRDVVGGMTLDELLAEREQIAQNVAQHVEADSKDWGLHVTGIRLQDIDMPEELKKIMSRQAGAEREKRATITKAEGDKLAAENLAAAAAIMNGSPGAMQLRTLQTIDGLGPSASNTVLLAVPIEFMQFMKKATSNP
jgi:regulator of protease activity HflC (stomatin/prohibitin superfamily)